MSEKPINQFDRSADILAAALSQIAALTAGSKTVYVQSVGAMQLPEELSEDWRMCPVEMNLRVRVVVRRLPTAAKPSEPDQPTLDWSRAEKHLRHVIGIYTELSDTPQVNCTPALELVLKPLLVRYESGERSEELFQQMTGVE